MFANDNAAAMQPGIPAAPAQGAGAAAAPAAPANFRGDVIKLIPKYTPGVQPWSSYKDAVLMHAQLDLCLGASDYTLKVAVRNYGLDAALQHRLRGRLIPRPNENMLLEDFLNQLGQELEGDLYSEDWRNQFINRVQYEGESVASYYETKLTLFENSTPPQYRDLAVFYRAVIEGLLNLEVKDRALFKYHELSDAELRDVNNLKKVIVNLSNLMKSRISMGLIPASAGVGISCPAPYMIGPDPTNLQYQRTRHGVHAVQAAEQYGIPRPGGSSSTCTPAWAYSRHPEAGQAVHALQHGRPRPGPQQFGQRTLPGRSNADDRAVSQGLCFWCLEKGHYKTECPKAAAGVPKAINAVEPDYHDPYDEYGQGYHDDQLDTGDVNYMNRSRPPRPRYNPGGGFYRPNPAKGRGQKPRFQIRQRPPGYRIHSLEEERPLVDFAQYHDDGTVTLAADIADALHGLTLQDLGEDGPDTAAVHHQETEAYSAAPAAVHALVPSAVPEHFLG